MLANYLDFTPTLEAPFELAPSAAVLGRTVAGSGLMLRELATLRADGEWVRVGRNGFFAERATVHIAHGVLGAAIGDDVSVGRFGLVHACTLEHGIVVGDGAAVMDGAHVGSNALIAADALVPPRKQLPGGFVYEGNPATPTREISASELADAHRALRKGARSMLTTARDLPPLDMVPFVPEGPREGPLHAIHGRSPQLGRAFVAPTSVIAGDVRIGDDSGVYFACVLSAREARITIGRRTNIQDNSLLVVDRHSGDLWIGDGVTVGHNVLLRSGEIADDALIGMLARVGERVVVERGGCIAAGAWAEPGTVVKAGWIWAGRPARPFRELKDSEREWFAQGAEVYVHYSANYRGERRAA